MNVLIIGGTGFIGNRLTQLFVKNEHPVAVFHRNKKTFDRSLNILEIIGHREDIISFKREFLSFKPALVIDTIAYTAQDSWSLQRALMGVTNNLLLLSSGDVYKAYDTFHKNRSDVDNLPLTEKSELRNRLYPYKPENTGNVGELLSNYDKIVVETMLQQKIFNTTILRLPAVFGEGDNQQKLSEYIKPMVTNQPSIILSAKKANWIWTRSYVDNVAYGIYLAATNKAAKNEVFNLGDINLTEFALVTRLKGLSGWQGKVIIDDAIHEPFNYAQNIQIDNTKIAQVLNYRAPISDESAFLRMIQNCR